MRKKILELCDNNNTFIIALQKKPLWKESFKIINSTSIAINPKSYQAIQWIILFVFVMVTFAIACLALLYVRLLSISVKKCSCKLLKTHAHMKLTMKWRHPRSTRITVNWTLYRCSATWKENCSMVASDSSSENETLWTFVNELEWPK